LQSINKHYNIHSLSFISPADHLLFAFQFSPEPSTKHEVLNIHQNYTLPQMRKCDIFANAEHTKIMGKCVFRIWAY